ncbi:MAG TPA: protein phosphatase 2C domain-containing protein [Candidatus Acidoferrales bacterium]|nr:protein phosphatase 2C domain-containing protein [Candidatus Acidoferrales bacterium]
MEIAVGTHPGVWQKHGGDAALAEALAPNVTLLAVADGFGSISRGLSIAQSALLFVRDFLRRKARTGVFATRATSSSSRRQLVLAALSYANSRLFSQSASHDDYVAGGASVTAALLIGKDAFVGHVGTSRACVMRKDALEIVTRDDAFEMVPPDDVRSSSAPAGLHLHTMVTRTLGTQPALEASVIHVELGEHDRLLLCTSGFHRRVATDEIHHSLLMTDAVADVVTNLLVTAKQRRLEHGSVVVASQLTSPLSAAEPMTTAEAPPGRVVRALAFTLVVVLLFGLATVAEFWR